VKRVEIVEAVEEDTETTVVVETIDTTDAMTVVDTAAAETTKFPKYSTVLPSKSLDFCEGGFVLA